MAKLSSGILLYRLKEINPEFFLVHPGGPFWLHKDTHAWSIPKGEIAVNENALETAIREFAEETGTIITGNFIELTPVRQKGGKTVFCFACEGDIDPAAVKSNAFEVEWPPRSGKMQLFPEIDKAGWFDAGTAMQKINEAQSGFISEILQKIRTEE